MYVALIILCNTMCISINFSHDKQCMQVVKFLFFSIFSGLSYFLIFFPISGGFVQSGHVYFLYKVELYDILVCLLFRYTFFRFFKCGNTCAD